MRGRGLRSITKFTSFDRKTVRRYVEAAAAAGLVRGSDEAEISDVLIGTVCDAVRPARPHDHGEAWEMVAVHRKLIQEWLDDDGLTLVKVNQLLGRRGVVVPYRTLHRFAAAELGFGRKKPTVRVADGEPGKELQVDYGRMGLIPDATRRRLCRALIFTACFSRHMFVWLTFRETLEATIEGFERAWEFFGGVFAVIVPAYPAGEPGGDLTFVPPIHRGGI